MKGGDPHRQSRWSRPWARCPAPSPCCAARLPPPPKRHPAWPQSRCPPRAGCPGGGRGAAAAARRLQGGGKGRSQRGSLERSGRLWERAAPTGDRVSAASPGGSQPGMAARRAATYPTLKKSRRTDHQAQVGRVLGVEETRHGLLVQAHAPMHRHVLPHLPRGCGGVSGAAAWARAGGHKVATAPLCRRIPLAWQQAASCGDGVCGVCECLWWEGGDGG